MLPNGWPCCSTVFLDKVCDIFTLHPGHCIIQETELNKKLLLAKGNQLVKRVGHKTVAISPTRFTANLGQLHANFICCRLGKTEQFPLLHLQPFFYLLRV